MHNSQLWGEFGFMKLLKNRKFAVLVAVVLVVLATLFGVGRSLNRLARDVEALFYADRYVDDDGATRRGIDPHLENSANAAFALAMLMVDNPALAGEANELLAARGSYLAADSIPGKFVANENMKRTFAALAGKAQGIELSEREISALATFSRDFNDAQMAIQGSPYNQKASDYMDGASFIAHVLRPFTFVAPPAYFGRVLFGSS
jgi:hypothetical protein